MGVGFLILRAGPLVLEMDVLSEVVQDRAEQNPSSGLGGPREAASTVQESADVAHASCDRRVQAKATVKVQRVDRILCAVVVVIVAAARDRVGLEESRPAG